jgi:hypothetical protein
LLYPAVLKRAETFFESGSVTHARRCGEVLEAYVDPVALFSVRIEMTDGGMVTACTCPFSRTAQCSHVGAMLLQWIRQPDTFTVTDEGLLPVSRGAEPPLSTIDRAQPWVSPSADPVDAVEARSTLADMLFQLRLDQLQQIARRRGWAVASRSKEGYAGELARKLSDATHVARTVTSLPGNLREALRAAFVVEDGHGISPEELAHAITALRGRNGVRIKPVEAAGLLVDLAAEGLVLPWDSFPGTTTYLLPWEIQAAVPPLPGWCPKMQGAPAPELNTTQETCFIQLLDGVWRQIAKQPPRLRLHALPNLNRHAKSVVQDWPIDLREVQSWQQSKGGNKLPTSVAVPPPQMLLADEDLARLVEVASVPAEKLEFLLQLMLELDLVENENERLLPRPAVMDRYTQGGSAEQWRAVAQAYLSMTQWSELDMLLRSDDQWVLARNPYFTIKHTHFRSQLARIRQMVARFLASAGERRYCPFSLVEGALPRLWPSFFQIRRSSKAGLLPAALELGMRDGPQSQEADQCLPQVAFLRTMLLGPLQWLGLLKTCSAHGEEAAFWCDGLGELLWGSPSETQGAPVAEPVSLDCATGTISVASRAVDPDIPTFLGQIAALESVHDGRYAFRLDAKAAHAAFEGGKLLSELEAEWNATMAHPMPDAFRRTLDQWWTSYGRVRLYEGFALLEVDNEVTLRELEATTSLGQHVKARVSPCHLLVPAELVDDLMREIRARGHTPQQVG